MVKRGQANDEVVEIQRIITEVLRLNNIPALRSHGMATRIVNALEKHGFAIGSFK